MIRHIVQTYPLWIAIVLAARNSALTKWAALPCFVFWLATEIVMPIIVGSAFRGGHRRLRGLESASSARNRSDRHVVACSRRA